MRRRWPGCAPRAYLVNTARGPIVHEHALADALRNGVIAGAALDVYEHEPAVDPGLLDLDNVVLVPHLGSATQETRDAMAALAARNVVADPPWRPAVDARRLTGRYRQRTSRQPAGRPARALEFYTAVLGFQ